MYNIFVRFSLFVVFLFVNFFLQTLLQALTNKNIVTSSLGEHVNGEQLLV